ncbi:MAG: class II aldolase/adducin family protein [Arcobacteraceae bacterium]
MKSLYNDNLANECTTDLEFRVYTSRLLGQKSALIMHCGGNTSVKGMLNGEEVLYIKGCSLELSNIETTDFTPLKLQSLQNMAKLSKLSDTDMVAQQKEAMVDQEAPAPSKEATLHAIIPFKYVDHTHSDAVVTISNCENGVELIEKLYPNYLIVPYVIPGFALVQTIQSKLKNVNLDKCEGIILHNHGIFTFDNDPKKSYEKMIDGVSKAEDFLNENAPLVLDKFVPKAKLDLDKLAEILSKEKGYKVFIKVNQSALALHYASQKNLKKLATRGVLIPEHIIRTKRNPMIILDKDIQKAIDAFEEEYLEYYSEFTSNEIMINPTPNWAIVKNFGTLSFGRDEKEALIIEDINNHTMQAVLRADQIGGYKSISLSDSFEMEYWELEQAKIKK